VNQVNQRVAGKIALVTGAGGIGQAIAQKLAEHGASVILADVDTQRGTLAAAKLSSAGLTVSSETLDVSSEGSWMELERKLTRDVGRLDILVNGAGVFAKIRQPFEAITFEEWRRVMSVNLDGVFLGTRCAIRLMKQRGGSIVNIASIAGVSASRGGASYGASKGGVINLTKQSAISCARAGYPIRVNCIHPGYVWTPGTADLVIAENGSVEAARAEHAARQPMGKPVEPEDVGWAVLYLASDESKIVTATELVVDGGILGTLWGV